MALRKLAAGVVREPIKVVVAGSSVSLFVTPVRSRRDEGTYGELLPAVLAESGVRADVEHVGQWFQVVTEIRPKYEHAIRNRFPDVLILDYGIIECQPNFVPLPLMRHFSTWDVSSRPLSQWYRRHLSWRLWVGLRWFGRVTAARTTSHSYRVSPKRFRWEMRRIIELAREETGCLVLVLDLDPPGERFTRWIPGVDVRRDRYQEILRSLVAELDDPDVRFVEASSSIAEFGFEQMLPDGIHRSAAGHAMTADMLADVVLGWLDEEPARRLKVALADRGVEGLAE
jgi:hypothetical protein